MTRPDALRQFIDATRNAFFAAHPRGEESAAGLRIFSALGTPGPIARERRASILPACEHLSPAIENARATGGPTKDLAECLEALEPWLSWRRRPGSGQHGEAFHRGHANAWIVAPNGIERRADVMVGVTLTAPQVNYPTHSHPPEEIYVVLSQGEWWRDGADWHAPGIGGTVYNPPGVSHAMRSGSTPLLTVWCLCAESRAPNNGARPIPAGG